MSTNPHEAVHFLMAPSRLNAPGQALDGREYPPSELNIEMAKVWAAMAIAYEQRTANLISAFAHLRDHEGITMLGDAYPLFNQIKERLDIE